MMTPHPANAPAGWYPDPTGTGDNRWWNGVEWTNNLGSLLSFIIYLASVIVAFFDWRHIRLTRVQKPFYWAWSILSILVCRIGRGVVMKDRVGRGFATM
jgi:hypothetical protein